MIRAIVTDVEGTTTAVSFVHETLFGHARRELPSFVAARAGEPAVRGALDEAKALAGDPAMSDAEIAAVLLRWMAEDRKATPLKALQGLVWEDGYRRGVYRAHVYPDVAPALRRFRARGVGVSVYSSGSVLAQRLLFAHSVEGDLTPLFDRYFDTATGPKREPGSYAKIAAALGAPPEAVLFLSDAAAELDAAKEAGLRCVGVARDGAEPPAGHAVVQSFDAIDLAALGGVA